MDDEYEDLSLQEKIQYKIQRLKEDFFVLPVWGKVTLLISGSILVAILFYTFFTVNRLTKIKKVSQPPVANSTLSNSTASKDSTSNENTDTQVQTRNINNAGQQTLQETAQQNSGVSGFLQNLLGGTSNQSTNNSAISNTSSPTGTQSYRSSTVTQNQPTTVPQQYIVNFLNGVLYFQDPSTGFITPYIISGINPADFVWGRYTNQTDGYAIDYPTNWSLVKLNDGGHEGLLLYPPGEDLTNDDAKKIGLGWSTRFMLPRAGGSDIYYQTSVTIDYTLGQLFTLGGGDEGGKGIAVLLPHKYGYFGLGGSADTNAFIYVFQRMLSSLTLTK